MVNPKVTAAALAAAVTTLVAAVARSAGHEIPADAQGALTTILVFVAGYFKSA